MKKTIAVILMLVLQVSLFASCNEVSTDLSVGSADDNSNVASEQNPMKFTIMLQASVPEYPPDGGEAKAVILEKIEKDLGITNVDFEVIFAPGSDYSTKLNAMISDGDIPDYFHADLSMLQTLVDNQVIAPLNDLMQYAPLYQETMAVDEMTQNITDSFTIDGNIYGFANGIPMLGQPETPNLSGMIIRTDWLENVDSEIPTTLDELHTVLQKFTFEDPDGNGVDDTYGLGGDKTNYFRSIFGAYGVFMSGASSWAERDGELVHTTTLPETKQALETLRSWYAEGLIDPDKFVIEATQSKDKFTAGQIGTYENSIWWANDARIAWAESQADESCTVIAPVSAVEGEKGGYPITTIKTFARVISQDCVDEGKAETLVKIINWMLDGSENGGLNLVQYGEEGVHYTYDEDRDFIDQSLISDYSELYSEGYNLPVRWIVVVDNRWIDPEDPRAIDMATINDPDTYLTTEFLGSVPALQEYPDLYDKLWAEYFTKIVIGTLPLDAFEEYVEKFYEQGGEELTNQVNEAWKNAE